VLGGVGLRSLAGRPVAIRFAMYALTAPAGDCLVVALAGWARERLSFSTPARAYLTEASLPIYVLHQLAIVGPGYFIIQSGAGPAAKFALLLPTSVLLTFAAYHFAVRRSRTLAAALGATR
jgi:peptidoglycan/LPS O-acetylase OafA/YrhL